MMKRILALALVLALACATAVTGFADDKTPVTVQYTGSELNYLGADPDTGAVMDLPALLPGAAAEGEVILTNNSGALANFYVDTEVVNTLQGTFSSGYVVKLWVEDLQTGETTVLFGEDMNLNPNTGDGTLVGGNDATGQGSNDELMELNDMLKVGATATLANGRNYLLAATLGNGESAALKLSITPDPTATTNAYSAKTGAIRFQFMAENVDIQSRTETREVKGADVVVTQTRYWLNGVQTGDPVAIAPLVIVLALAVLVFIVAAKKKNKKEE